MLKIFSVVSQISSFQISLLESYCKNILIRIKIGFFEELQETPAGQTTTLFLKILLSYNFEYIINQTSKSFIYFHAEMSQLKFSKEKLETGYFPRLERIEILVNILFNFFSLKLIFIL